MPRGTRHGRARTRHGAQWIPLPHRTTGRQEPAIAAPHRTTSHRTATTAACPPAAGKAPTAPGVPGAPHPHTRARARTTVRRGVSVLACAALLVGGSAACSAAEHLTTGLRVKQAVENLGNRESVSVTAGFDATPAEIHAYLQEGSGKGKGGNARENARLLADLQLAVSVAATKPLRELAPSDRVDSAASVSFGGKDVSAFKAVDRKLYIRTNAKDLAAEIGTGRGPLLDKLSEVEPLTRGLPSSLDAARTALRGKWVRIRPKEFGEFTEALGGRAGERTDRVTDASAVLNRAGVQQRLVSAVESTLGDHARFTDAGDKEGAEQVTMTLPARTAGEQLAQALRPVQKYLGELDLDMLERAPDKEVTMDLAIRHDTLSTLTVDIGQFDEGRSGRLPLKLTFAGGEAVLVAAPNKAETLEPQDLLAALTYAAAKDPELSDLL